MTTYFAGTLTGSPVRGLRAVRAARFLTSKTPKFRSSIRSSSISVSMIESNTRCTISFTLSWVSPKSSEIRLTISFLVTATQGTRSDKQRAAGTDPMPRSF